MQDFYLLVGGFNYNLKGQYVRFLSNRLSEIIDGDMMRSVAEISSEVSVLTQLAPSQSKKTPLPLPARRPELTS